VCEKTQDPLLLLAAAVTPANEVANLVKFLETRSEQLVAEQR